MRCNAKCETGHMKTAGETVNVFAAIEQPAVGMEDAGPKMKQPTNQSERHLAPNTFRQIRFFFSPRTTHFCLKSLFNCSAIRDNLKTSNYIAGHLEKITKHLYLKRK